MTWAHDFDVAETNEAYDKSRLRIVNHIFLIHVIIYMVFSFSSDQLDRQESSLLKILNKIYYLGLLVVDYRRKMQ